MKREFSNFQEFFPFYLSQHQNKTNQYLHAFGTTLTLIIWTIALSTQMYGLFPIGLMQGYAWAWVGHFCFEKNKPATFKHPFYSLIGDAFMYYYVITGQIDRKSEELLN